MRTIPANISILLLIVILIVGAFSWKVLAPRYRFFLFFISSVFIYEAVMFFTASQKINNHLIININTIGYFILVLLMLAKVYKQYNKFNIHLNKIIIPLIAFFATAWVIDNFFQGHTISVFNTTSCALSAIVVGILGIYILNPILYANSTGLHNDPDVLIIGGILIRSLVFGLFLLFIEFYKGFDAPLASRIIFGVNIGLCLSDVLFLWGVIKAGRLGRGVKVNRSVG